MNNADKPAYPIAGSYDDEHPQVIVPVEHGLTKRELIAAMIAQGLAANPEWMKEYKGEKYLMIDRVAAEVAVNRADVLLEELNKPKQ